MNRTILRNLRLANSKEVAPNSTDITIENGIITAIGNATPFETDLVHDFQGAFVSPGWMDMHVHLREPGFEHKETILTGTNAAAFGGFTAVACMPNTKPAIHTRDVVEFIIQKAEPTLVDVYPIACVTKDRKGESITEMADLRAGGAVAFSDDGDPVHDSRIMRIALEYSSMYNMPIINHEEDLALSRPGHMNEGAVSDRLGLAGTPGVAEEVMIARDIMLAEFTGGHVHVAHISTAKGVELVRRAKKDGIKVTTEVCTHHFDLTDEEIDKRHFDTICKIHPPLRTEHDRLAMIEGLKDGTIDVICTDHAPHSVEEKDVEFIYAPNGIIGLETAWGITAKRLIHEHGFPLPLVLEKLVDNPRRILNIAIPEIKVGEKANLTIFTTDDTWIFERKHIKSKSKNTPYVGTEMRGRALAVFNKGKLQLNQF